ncbi:alpha/beta hydrolase [Belnapia sp. F-4-1]|uniref:alpha/beta hydrolase n=1 Tax=Belnapia sp. F-4-1 TaxID=1545443 RepID=UPI0005BC8500|nr:alpha/beta hydrolase [Belnapia sp. F-4-1]
MFVRKIRFATNRKPLKGGFGPDCEDPRAMLRLGRVQVRSCAQSALDAELVNGSLRVEHSEAAAADRQDWLLEWLAGARDSGRVPVLSVHGFCYSFVDAVTRAGQIAAFYAEGPFAVQLAPLAFCWPSGGELDNSAYTADRTSCERSDEALALLIRDVGAAANAVGVRPVLLAHSMGVFMLRLGISALVRDGLPDRPPFAQVVAMAGDDDWTVLDADGPLCPVASIADWVTLGVYPADAVIRLNHSVLGRPKRLGAYGPNRPDTLPPNVAVVDYAYAVDVLKQLPPEAWQDVSWNAVSHQYYRNDRRVRDDLAQVFRGATPEEVLGRRRGAELINPTVAINPKPDRLYPVGEQVV